MSTEEYPVGVLGVGPGWKQDLDWKTSDAGRLASAAQREALRLIDQLAAHMKTLGLTPAQIEEKSGLPAAMVTEGIEAGDLSFVDFVIIARVVGVRVHVEGAHVVETSWPEAAVLESPPPPRWSNPPPDETPEPLREAA